MCSPHATHDSAHSRVHLKSLLAPYMAATALASHVRGEQGADVMENTKNSAPEMLAQLTKGVDRVDLREFAGGIDQEMATLPQIRLRKKWYSTAQILTVVLPTYCERLRSPRAGMRRDVTYGEVPLALLTSR